MFIVPLYLDILGNYIKHVILELNGKSIHNKNVIVCCAISASQIFGPVFTVFEDEDGKAIILNFDH